MENIPAFLHYLTEKSKKQTYIDMSRELLDNLRGTLGNKTPSSEAIDTFVRRRWSGYVSRDKDTYRILNDYADFCETEWLIFSNAFREHVRDTFESEARKAMKTYKNAIVPIPKDTRIDPYFLGGLTNDDFVTAFKSFQEFIYAIYDGIERGSPFDWGWPDWNAITWEGINHNRVMMVLDAMVNSGEMDSDLLVVDKKRFSRHNICKPIAKTNLMLEGFMRTGLHIEGLDDKKSDSFSVACPDTPNLIYVLHSYFKHRDDGCKNHIHVFSYRFVENPDVQTRETFFLAKTDGEPEQLREIYYWLYDEAVKHGFLPQGKENMGCYSYKRGKDDWLLLGSGHSYHEDEFLHSPNYKLAAKAKFFRVFQTHPDKTNKLLKRFPESIGRPWDWCFCNNLGSCKNRVMIEKDGRNYHHCCTKTYLYFHDPNFDDVKAILELYKIENNIKPL